MRRKRKTPNTDIPVASMGDIAFLLIIFFIVCGNFAKSSQQVDLPRERDLEIVKELPKTVVTIDNVGRIYLQGVEMELPQFASAIEAMLAPIPPDRRRVFLRGYAGLERKDFEPVIEAIGKAGGQLLMAGDAEQTP